MKWCVERFGGVLIGSVVALALCASARAADQPAEQAAEQEVLGRAAVTLTPGNGASGGGGRREFVIDSDLGTVGGRQRGRVQVEGAGNFPGGDVGDAEWVLKGRNLSGRVVRERDVIGSFTGTVDSSGGVSGVFVMSDGTHVKWTWVAEGANGGEGADGGGKADSAESNKR